MNRTPTRRVLQGLLAAAMTAWGLMVVYTLVLSIAGELARDGGARADVWQQAFGLLAMLAIFGIPVAIVSTLLVGYPMWRVAENKGFRTRRAGLLWGALCGSILSILATVRTVLTANPGSSYGGSEGDFMIDGHLTALGWASEFRSLIFLALLGACSGFVAVWVAKRPNPEPVQAIRTAASNGEE